MYPDYVFEIQGIVRTVLIRRNGKKITLFSIPIEVLVKLVNFAVIREKFKSYIIAFWLPLPQIQFQFSGKIKDASKSQFSFQNSF